MCDIRVTPHGVHGVPNISVFFVMSDVFNATRSGEKSVIVTNPAAEAKFASLRKIRVARCSLNNPNP